MSQTTIDSGIYPMVYSFFTSDGVLRLDAFRHQVDAAIRSNAAGIAILGLGTEVSALLPSERVAVLDVVSRHLNGELPLLATVYGSSTEEQIDFSQQALDKGATALVLQPPARKMEDQALREFFSETISRLDCPIGIQNAPEFLGYGLSNESLIALARDHQNFRLAKLECSAVALQPVAQALAAEVAVFNGRCGLELTDNLRAGARGLIPAIETIDKIVPIYDAFLKGDEESAERLYTELTPVLSFIMQGIPHFLTYGKLLAALRLKLDPGGNRDPALTPTKFGYRCTERFANYLQCI
jgi:4-hydroxy-tetrahydrodipicolinate synthase